MNVLKKAEEFREFDMFIYVWCDENRCKNGHDIDLSRTWSDQNMGREQHSGCSGAPWQFMHAGQTRQDEDLAG